MFLNFALEYAIMKVPENHEELEFSEIRHVLVYADVNLFGANRNSKMKTQ
jgi:hypothetical protein